MDLPSSREIELESLLRQRDAQVAGLSDELSRLRQFLSNQAGPSEEENVTIPPPLMALLLQRMNNEGEETGRGARTASSTVTAALTQRAKLLQEENEELYLLLSHGETGRLKEEVVGLRRFVKRLEGALRESHSVIVNLTSELDQSYESFKNANILVTNSQSHSPQNLYRPLPPTSSNNGSSRILPTAPRAHKKPRLSDSRPSSSPRLNSLPLTSQNHNHQQSSSQQSQHSQRNVNQHQSNHGGRDFSPRDGRGGANGGGKANHVKMEVDGDNHSRACVASPMRDGTRENRGGESGRGDRGRDRAKDRDRDRERDNNDRERDRDRSGRRNGHGGRGRRQDRHTHGGDRTLAERMGL